MRSPIIPVRSSFEPMKRDPGWVHTLSHLVVSGTRLLKPLSSSRFSQASGPTKASTHTLQSCGKLGILLLHL